MNLRIASIIFNNEDEKETAQLNKIKANIRLLVGAEKLETTMQDNEEKKACMTQKIWYMIDLNVWMQNQQLTSAR